MRILSLLSSILMAIHHHHSIDAYPTNTLINDLETVPEFHCIDREAFRQSRNGSPRNCARALMSSFPNSIVPGQFHHGTPDDTFRLPRASHVGDCQVTVDLNGGNPTPGSWQQVWTLTNTLSTACTYYKNSADLSTAVTGGYVHAGQGKGLTIILAKPGTNMGNDSGIASG